MKLSPSRTSSRRLGHKPPAQGAVGAAAPDGAAPGRSLCLRIALADAEAFLALQRTARKWDDAAMQMAQATDLCRLLVPALDTAASLENFHERRFVGHLQVDTCFSE